MAGTEVTPEYRLADILKSTDYGLDVFDPKAVADLEIFDKKGKPYLYDPVSDKDRSAKPEEIVRQLFLREITAVYGYPRKRIAVERAVRMGRDTTKSADIIIYREDDPEAAYIIVEVKKPREKDGLEQLKTYCNAEGAPIAVWTNGGRTEILHREDPNVYTKISRIPDASETLDDVIGQPMTLEDLEERNLLVTQKWTLKKIILDLENLVLANAGVDPFEEVFKLIYAKLYDEWKAARPGKNFLLFRVKPGESDKALYDRIAALFNDAKRKWQGVFLPGERIDLTPSHLKTCVSFLQDIKLFNSNLQVIDEAFEYLVTQVAKGAKGQYFTPRHVIDMAVRMTNPKLDEYVIDPAAGSCGFTVHTIFHVWGGEFLATGPEKWQSEYAAEMVYGLDFDARAVKIAKALNLIAGDGRTNVYRVNTLDPRHWPDEARVGLRDRLRRFDDPVEDEANQKGYRYFDFHVVLSNPPFAGDLRDSRVLAQYDLAQKFKAVNVEKLSEKARKAYLADPDANAFEVKGRGKKQSRDILFLERSLDFLRPGGRMAVVLPQGRFNNVSDASFRWWISRHARILAVVGLDVNTFKPHTGTKTSVLFLQKWNDDASAGPLCPRADDYPVFFATSEHPGKDNRGEYVYVEGPDGTPLLDLFHHPIVDHDLFDPRVVIEQQLDRLLERDAGDAEALEHHRDDFVRIVQHLPQRPTIAEAFETFAEEQGFTFLAEG